MAMEKSGPFASQGKPIDLDLDALLHPAQAFGHPREVVNDPDLSLNEKRAILASWASDACAVEAAPALRCVPGGKQTVSIDEILESLRALDKEAHAQDAGAAHYRRQVRRGWMERLRASRRRGRDDPPGGPAN
jgi:hypothetical protein